MDKMNPNSQTEMEIFFLEWYLAFIKGNLSIKRTINLNELVNVKPMRVHEYLKQWWA